MKFTTAPFPHFVEHDWFGRYLLADCAAEFPDADDTRWRRYGNDQEFKLEGPAATWGPRTWDYFEALSERACRLSDLFNLPELYMEMVGGGYHLIPPGGYLNVHTDFSVSPTSGRYRRLNVLTFLNRDWTADDGGQLELWDADAVKVSVLPEFGTTVAFETSSRSWHGHPNPTKRWRASLAAYFFTDDPPPDFTDQSTVWHPNGGRNA